MNAFSCLTEARPSSTVRPPLVGEGLGGGTHQALELLTRRVDCRPRRPRTAPAPAVALGQPNEPPAREDGGAPRRHPVEARRVVPIDEHRPRPPLPARPMLTSPSAPVRSAAPTVRRVPSTKATRRVRSGGGRPVRDERPRRPRPARTRRRAASAHSGEIDHPFRPQPIVDFGWTMSEGDAALQGAIPLGAGTRRSTP